MQKYIKYLVESFIDDENEITDIDLNFDNRLPYVDLGLPSRTLWARCNLGANSPEEYGLYYQWGSLECHEAETFDFNENDYYEKYSENYYGLSELKEEDDAAYVESNGLSRIPTKEQIQELIDNCEYKWTKLNGVEGAKFTGPNGNSIFIPAAGYCSGSSIYNVGSYCYIWIQSLKAANLQNTYYMYCNSSSAYLDSNYRYYGFSVRAVLNKNNRGGISFFSVSAGTKINTIDASNTDIFDDKE